MNGTTLDLEKPERSAQVPAVIGKLEATRRELRGYGVWLGLVSLLLAELAVAADFVVADWVWVLPAWRAGAWFASDGSDPLHSRFPGPQPV